MWSCEENVVGCLCSFQQSNTNTSLTTTQQLYSLKHLHEYGGIMPVHVELYGPIDTAEWSYGNIPGWILGALYYFFGFWGTILCVLHSKIGLKMLTKWTKQPMNLWAYTEPMNPWTYRPMDPWTYGPMDSGTDLGKVFLL